jgi:hypothetical protein
MDLHTHIFFGVALGLGFFGHIELALLVGLGAMLPDLDGDYWFIPPRGYREELLHRAFLHNVFVIVLAYLVSPFLSLGVFIHVIMDSFTTCKDRGCEWFWPFSRRVKLGLYDKNMEPQPLDPKEKIYYYHQDPQGFIEYQEALPDREIGPLPWRRVYGPAQNSQLLDRLFLWCSIAFICLWIFGADGSNFTSLVNYLDANYLLWLVGFVSVGLIFGAGELDRRDKPLRLPNFNYIKYPIFVLGLFSFGVWLILYRANIFENLEIIFSDSISVLLSVLIVVVVSLVVLKWETRADKIPAIV